MYRKCHILLFYTFSLRHSMHFIELSLSFYSVEFTTKSETYKSNDIIALIYVTGFTKTVPIGTRNEIQFIADY